MIKIHPSNTYLLTLDLPYSFVLLNETSTQTYLSCDKNKTIWTDPTLSPYENYSLTVIFEVFYSLLNQSNCSTSSWPLFVRYVFKVELVSGSPETNTNPINISYLFTGVGRFTKRSNGGNFVVGSTDDAVDDRRGNEGEGKEIGCFCDGWLLNIQ